MIYVATSGDFGTILASLIGAGFCAGLVVDGIAAIWGFFVEAVESL